LVDKSAGFSENWRAISWQFVSKTGRFLSKIGKWNEKIDKWNEKTVKNNNMTSTKFAHANSP
jgi:hypothetical protein